MKELIAAAVLVASLYGGSILGEQILQSVRKAALTKAAQGLPSLSTLSRSLTSRKSRAAPAESRHLKDSYR